MQSGRSRLRTLTWSRKEREDLVDRVEVAVVLRGDLWCRAARRNLLLDSKLKSLSADS